MAQYFPELSIEQETKIKDMLKNKYPNETGEQRYNRAKIIVEKYKETLPKQDVEVTKVETPNVEATKVEIPEVSLGNSTEVKPKGMSMEELIAQGKTREEIERGLQQGQRFNQQVKPSTISEGTALKGDMGKEAEKNIADKILTNRGVDTTIPEDQNFFEKSHDMWANKFGNIKQIRQSDLDPISTSLQTLGNLASGVIGQGLVGLGKVDDTVLAGKVQQELSQTLDFIKDQTYADEIASSYAGQVMEISKDLERTNPKTSKVLKTIGNDLLAGMDIVDVMGAGALVKMGGKQLLKTTIGKEAQRSAMAVRSKIDNTLTGIKKATKGKELDELAGNIFQGGEEGRTIGTKVLTSDKVDIKGVKTFDDLGERVDVGAKTVLKEQNNLMKGTKGGVDNFKTTIETPKGMVEKNFMEQAIDDVEVGLKNIGLEADYNNKLFDGDTLGNVIIKIQTGEATGQEIADFIRYYGHRFKNKIFTKSGGTKLGDISQSLENTRQGLKEGMENVIGNKKYAKYRELDAEYSDLMKGKQMIDKNKESLIKTEDKLKDLGVTGKITRGLFNLADTVTLGIGKKAWFGIVSKALPNMGNMMMNNISLREALPGFIKRVEKLNKKLNKINITKSPTLKAKLVDDVKTEVKALALEYDKNVKNVDMIDATTPQEITPKGVVRKQGKQTVTELGVEQPKGNIEGLTAEGTQSIPEGSIKLRDNFEMKKGDMTQYGVIEDIDYSGGNKKAIINGKKHYASELGDVYRKEGKSFDDMLNEKTVNKETAPELGKTPKSEYELRAVLEELGLEEVPDDVGDIKKISTILNKNTSNAKRNTLTKELREKYSESFNKVGATKVPKFQKEADLVSEAKKYKSADEFVKAQGTPLYHGSDIKIKEFDYNKKDVDIKHNETSNLGFFFSFKKDIAERYAKNKAFMKLDDKTKSSFGKNLRESYNKSNIKGEVTETFSLSKNVGELKYNGKTDFKKVSNDLVELKNKGFDSVVIKGWDDGMGGDQLVIFDAKQIKTKDQLKDIRNKANKTQKLGARGPGFVSKDAPILSKEQILSDVNNYQKQLDTLGIKVDKEGLGNILKYGDEEVVGYYVDGIIKIGKGRPGTLEHELVHGAFDLGVSKAEKQAILKQIKKQTGFDDIKAEEWLADNFIKYVNGTKTFKGKIKDIFDRVINFAKSFVGKEDKVKVFYRDLKKNKLNKIDTPSGNKKFMKVDLTKDDIKVYRGEGKGIGNTTFVEGQYFADSKEFASNFGKVKEDIIPKGSKIFDFDKIKNNPDQKVIPKQILVNPKATSYYLSDKGFDATKNTNTRGVEYVKLNKDKYNLLKLAMESKTETDFTEKLLNNWDKYESELNRIRKGFNMAQTMRTSAKDIIWKDARELKKYFNTN